MRHSYRFEWCVAHLMYAGDNRWMLTSIKTVLPKYRGRGYARHLLEAITHEADHEGVTLLLTIDPDPDTDPERLRAWYYSHGFTDILEDPGHRAMIRVPRPSADR